MYWLKRPFVWMSRIGHCRGFGIQSPTDYWFVRYVINEHWPYYQYETLGQGDDPRRRKLGRLYFRLANWRQPQTILDTSPSYREYWQAGCRKAVITSDADCLELIRLDMKDDVRGQWKRLLVSGGLDERTVLVLENIQRDRQLWQEIVSDPHTGISYDLYDCGIVLFDTKRHKKNYIINF